MLTIPVDNRKCFTLWKQFGFDAFTCKLCGVPSVWNGFSSSNSIPEDDSLSDKNSRYPSFQKTRELKIDKAQREHTIVDENPRDPKAITFSDNDFASELSVPIESDFTLPTGTGITVEEDPAIDLVHRKQHKLAALHESFGHLSFSVLKLMARADLIPRELANVDPPTCPGCAYGKEHHKPWRQKGVKNSKNLKSTTTPGQVISVDKFISPNPGFLPTHCGTPTVKR